MAEASSIVASLYRAPQVCFAVGVGVQSMTREELLICQRHLHRRGYRYFYIYGRDPDRWCLRARRYASNTREGLYERVVEFCEVEQFPQEADPRAGNGSVDPWNPNVR